MSGHSRWSPSAAKRWMSCPASIKASAGVPEAPPSPYARKGTAVAKVAEIVMANDTALIDMVGAVIEGEEFTREDVEPLQIYLDLLHGFVRDGDRIYTEQRLDLTSLWKGLYGHADAVAVGKTLTIVDLKWGEGVYVDHIDNPQLKIYAIGALLQYDPEGRYDFVDMIICQPRFANGTGVRALRLSANELWRWAIFTLLPALRETEYEDARYVPGDHCRWCAARPTCPALREYALEQAKADFQPVSELDGVAIGEILDRAQVVEDWIRAVRDEAMARLQRGETVAGYTLGVGRTTREWADEGRTIEFLRTHYKLLDDDLFKTELRSPAQVEKLIPKKDRPELQHLVTFKQSGPKLVRAENARAPVLPRVDEDFTPAFLA